MSAATPADSTPVPPAEVAVSVPAAAAPAPVARHGRSFKRELPAAVKARREAYDKHRATVKAKKITKLSQFKQLKSRGPVGTSRSVNPYFTNQNLGANQNWLAELSPDLLSNDNPLWTKDTLKNMTPSVTTFDDEYNYQVVAVDDLVISFNSSFSGDNSTIHITTDKYDQFSSAAQSLMWYDNNGMPFIASAASESGFYFYSYHDGDIYYFTTASLVPLEQDSFGQIVTWRLDMTRDYGNGGGDELAMQVLIRIIKQDGYSQLSFSIRQTTAEVDYMNTENYYYAEAYIESPTSLTRADNDNDVYHTSYSIESVTASGGVLPYYNYSNDDDIVYIDNHCSFGVYGGGDGDVPDLSGFTFHARFPDRSVDATVGDAAAVAAAATPAKETKKLIFGFDLMTLLFVLLIVVVGIFMITYSTAITDRFGWSKSTPAAVTASPIETN